MQEPARQSDRLRASYAVFVGITGVALRRSRLHRLSGICRDEIVAVEIADRQLGLDEALALVEPLQVGEPTWVHGSEGGLPLVGALGVVGEDPLHQLLLAL